MTRVNGQSLIELVIVVAVIVIVVGALTFATIASLRNSKLAQNQTQATKLAQEGLEKARVGRDQDSTIYFLGTVPSTTWKSASLWTNRISDYCGTSTCYFKLEGTNLRQVDSLNSAEIIGDQFKRAIILSDETAGDRYKIEKIVVAQVRWKDFAGDHESRLSTILGKQ